jgi:hypothetical protein
MVQVVKHLPSMLKTPSSNPRTTKKEEKKKVLLSLYMVDNDGG